MTATMFLRNVALVGHSGAGKTTLAEALLLRAGVVDRMGRVEDGTTVCDFEPEEIKRRISLSPSFAPFRWKAPDGETYKINLIDTPGYADFAGGVDAALTVADLAVFVVSAVGGVEVGTEVVWKQCVDLGIPRLVFVNKADRPNANVRKVFGQIAELPDAETIMLQLPLGEEDDHRGIVEIVSGAAYAYAEDGKRTDVEVPADLETERAERREAVVEDIVSGDEEQMERYLSGETIEPAELLAALRHQVLDGEAVPVLTGSTVVGSGIDRLADLICLLGPSPADRPVTVTIGGAEIEVEAKADGDPLLHVFRTVADPFVGQLSVFKVLSGTVRNDDHLTNSETGTDERLHGLFHLRGKEHDATKEIVAGDLGAVAKLGATPSGSSLAKRGVKVEVPNLEPRPTPYAVALKPATQADDDKLSSSLARLAGEDPTILVDRSETGQTLLRGAGDTHIAVALERLSRKFGVNVTTEPLQIAYRETLGRAVDVEGKLKKQSGGHGQFAVVQFRVSPQPQGSGVEFVDSVVGGTIPRNFIPAVEKGVLETVENGGLHGYPIVDIKVDCYEGKYHSVDSSDMAFRTAASLGVKEALAKGGSVVLEPISLVTVTVPGALQGDVMGDLSSRRGRISGTDVDDDGTHRIQAMVPESELTRYVMDLRSITGGRGSFTAVFDHYDVLPPNLVPAKE